MKASHRRILKWLAEGARIWAPSGACRNSRRAWVCLPDGHSDDGARILVKTLREMTEAGLIVNQFGVWNAGDEYADNIWSLPGAKENP